MVMDHLEHPDDWFRGGGFPVIRPCCVVVLTYTLLLLKGGGIGRGQYIAYHHTAHLYELLLWFCTHCSFTNESCHQLLQIDSCTYPPTLYEEVPHYEIIGLVLLGNLWDGGGGGQHNTTLANNQYLHVI